VVVADCINGILMAHYMFRFKIDGLQSAEIQFSLQIQTLLKGESNIFTLSLMNLI
jgi:hypothetical protein